MSDSVLSSPLALARITLPVVMSRLVRVVVPLWVSLVMAVLFLLTAVDWHGLSAGLARQAPGPLAALAVAAWALLTRRAFVPVLAARPLAALVRQPIGPLGWSVVLLPALVGAALPLAAVPLLAGRSHEVPAWLLAGGLGVVAAAPRGAVGVVGALAAGALAGGVADLPGLAGLLVALLGYLLLAGRLWTLSLRSGALVQPALPGRPAEPLGALLRLDLLATLRSSGGTLVGGYLAAALALGWLAAASGGGLPAASRPVATAVVAGLACLGPLAALGEGLSHRPLLDPSWWPVDPWHRALSLSLAALAVCGPVLAGAGVAGGSVEGGGRALLLGLALAPLGTAAAAWSPRHPLNMGLLVALLAPAVALAAAPWPLPALDLALAGAAVGLLGRRLAARRGAA